MSTYIPYRTVEIIVKSGRRTRLWTTHGVPELEARRVLSLQRLEFLPHDDVVLSLRRTKRAPLHAAFTFARNKCRADVLSYKWKIAD